MTKRHSPPFPHMHASQYVLIHAEVQTGIVLTTHGDRYNGATGVGEIYLIFEGSIYSWSP